MNATALAMAHLERLAGQIGPRPSGSEANHAAAEYIAEVFHGAGLDVEEQRYDVTAWQESETLLEMDGQPLAGAANPFSLPCDVSGRGIPMGTVAELEAAELSGCIGILYGDLTQAPLSAKSWFLKSERDDHIIRLLEEKKPAALIAVQAKAGELDRLIEDWEFDIPSVTVPAGTGLALLRQGNPALRLRIVGERTPGYSANIVARKAGTRQAKLVLCAHYDTKVDTPGAVDNAAGAAVLLTLAQLLGRREHALGIEWIAFSGEEYLPLGDDEYLRRCGDQLGQIVAALNFDGVGYYPGASSIMMVTHSKEFELEMNKLTKAYPGVVWVEPWPQSNHSTFAWRGVPSLAFSSTGAFSTAHLRTDTVEWVSPDKLAEVVALTGDIVESLQDKSPDWARAA